MRLAPLVLLGLLAGCAAAPKRADIRAGDIRGVEWYFALNWQYLRDAGRPEWENCGASEKLGGGDCDDYAQCAAEILESWPGCLVWRRMYPTKSGQHHAVTRFECYGYGGIEKGFFDNGLYAATDSDLLE